MNDYCTLPERKEFTRFSQVESAFLNKYLCGSISKKGSNSVNVCFESIDSEHVEKYGLFAYTPKLYTYNFTSLDNLAYKLKLTEIKKVWYFDKYYPTDNDFIGNLL